MIYQIFLHFSSFVFTPVSYIFIFAIEDSKSNHWSTRPRSIESRRVVELRWRASPSWICQMCWWQDKVHIRLGTVCCGEQSCPRDGCDDDVLQEHGSPHSEDSAPWALEDFFHRMILIPATRNAESKGRLLCLVMFSSHFNFLFPVHQIQNKVCMNYLRHYFCGSLIIVWFCKTY